MKTIMLLGVACVAMLFTGCRTVAVVDHGRPTYARSGYYRSSPNYYSSRRPYYRDSRYRYSRSYRSPYSDGRYYGSRYYGSRTYGRGGYYRPSGTTVVFR